MSLFLTAVAMGVFSGGHCLGMCGPLVLALPASESSAQRSPFTAAVASRVVYNFGRIFTYMLLGALTGLIGTAASVKGLQKYVSYAAGSLLILVSLLQLNPIGQFQMLTGVQNYVRGFVTRFARNAGPGRFLVLGIANGFLPCGMVAIALMASFAAGTSQDGILYMFYFGLGTFPLMLAASLFGIYIRPKLRRFLSVAGPIYGVALGLLILLRPAWILPNCN